MHKNILYRLLKIFFVAVIALIVAVQFASLVDGMGLCFGGYPACCQGGKNTCGPFCASCSRYLMADEISPVNCSAAPLLSIMSSH